jgi:hypothetical protein
MALMIYFSPPAPAWYCSRGGKVEWRFLCAKALFMGLPCGSGQLVPLRLTATIGAVPEMVAFTKPHWSDAVGFFWPSDFEKSSSDGGIP